MELREYLKKIKKEHGSSSNWFCERAGLASYTLRRILFGEPFTIETMCKIVEASNGEVTYEDLANLYLRNIKPKKGKDTGPRIEKEE